jgi:hypothetical protein
MLNLCKYKDLFGKPKTGIHKYRIYDFAILDILVTIIVAYGISWYLDTPFLLTLGLFFIFGIFVHRIFCVRTTVDKIVFPNIDE